MAQLGFTAIAGTTALFLTALGTSPAAADGISPANDGTGTQVNRIGNDHAITGGTPSADTQNLFHSFSDFNLLTGETATFLTDPAIKNILSRITGGNPSLIDGLLQVSGSDANLFLINPSGILLGPNSALNLQGSFTAITADQVNFATGTFGTVGTPDYATLVGNPQSFSFTANSPGSVVNAGTLSVFPGESVVLVGGQVLNTGTITTPGGTVIISAVDGNSLVRIAQEGLLLNLEVATLPDNPQATLLPFTPATLPELLTGNAMTEAAGVTVNPDGSITLTSGPLVQTTPGAATVAGMLDVSASQGGQAIIAGSDIALPTGLIDISGTVTGGDLAVYASNTLELGIGVNAAGGGHALFDPPTFTIDAAEATTIVDTLNGGDATVTASETITVAAPIDSSAQTDNNNTLFLVDENADGALTINLDALISLGTAQTLAGDGSTVNVAATGSVQNGVDVAANGATVNLATGNYQEGDTVTLTRDITLNGAGAGSTILIGDTTYHLLEIMGDVTATINTLTLTTGGTEQTGGGIRNFGILTLNDSTLSGNSAVQAGGGIDNAGTLTLNNSTVSGNNAYLGDGGGINNTGTLTITGSIISGNIAASSGGGIASSDGTLSISNSTVSGNRANADSGGGIQVRGNTRLSLANSTVSGNIATRLGGGIALLEAASAIVENSTIANNAAIDNGGGIALNTTLLQGAVAATVRNSTISNNTSETNGGGFFVSESNALSLDQGTVTENTAAIVGSGIFNMLGGQVTLSNTIVSENTGDNIDGAFTDAATNLIGGDALLGPLMNNGGPTQTHALLTGSPAIDAGSGIGPDQRGAPVVNTIRDIGAFEFGSAPPAPPDPPDPPNPPNPPNPSDPPDSPNPPGPSDPADDPTACFIVCGSNNPAENDTDRPTETDRNVDEASDPVSAYEEYLEVEARAFNDFDVLKRAADITGVPPALVYASFVPASGEIVVSEATGLSKSLPEETLAQQQVAEAEKLAGSSQAQNPENSADTVLELVLVTPDDRPRRFVTGATRTEVLQAVRQLQLELTDRTRRRKTDYLQPAQQLYSWLVAPLETALAEEDIGHISFILDQGLRSLPLAALHDGEQFIIENYTVGLMPSLSLTDTRIASIQNASVLAMGAAEFSDQPALPAVPLELATIESLWPGSRYLNETFTPETIVQARQQTPYAVLHLATHGEFANGALDNSYIQFWDQRLGLDQLPQLQLSAPTVELLVLSACRTVLGGENAELGFAGLAVKSGAKSAIAALWRVNDLETAGFMAEFYTQLNQSAYKAQALQQAQLAMLQGDVVIKDGNLVWSGGTQPLPETLSNVELADIRHPYYWSAFTLVGSPW
ncbi:MAG: CHAT domain-containing protein [Leptolyngbya sp. SIO1E4]|nr:CHAT domain-containing protein [Leptolyngbya sp. SIO1E4]